MIRAVDPARGREGSLSTGARAERAFGWRSDDDIAERPTVRIAAGERDIQRHAVGSCQPGLAGRRRNARVRRDAGIRGGGHVIATRLNRAEGPRDGLRRACQVRDDRVKSARRSRAAVHHSRAVADFVAVSPRDAGRIHAPVQSHCSAFKRRRWRGCEGINDRSRQRRAAGCKRLHLRGAERVVVNRDVVDRAVKELAVVRAADAEVCSSRAVCSWRVLRHLHAVQVNPSRRAVVGRRNVMPAPVVERRRKPRSIKVRAPPIVAETVAAVGEPERVHLPHGTIISPAHDSLRTKHVRLYPSGLRVGAVPDWQIVHCSREKLPAAAQRQTAARFSARGKRRAGRGEHRSSGRVGTKRARAVERPVSHQARTAGNRKQRGECQNAKDNERRKESEATHKR